MVYLVSMRSRIVQEVDRLHKELWRRRDKIYPSGCSPFDLLKPQLCAEILGYEYIEVPSLDWPLDSQKRIAGQVDPLRKLIAISSRFRTSEKLFTGAHEIGHVVLHEPKELLRERPIDGPRANQQDYREREADCFAAQFLMPTRLMRRAFENLFGEPPPIRLDDSLAFWLSPDDPGEVLFADKESLLPVLRLARFSPISSNYRPMNEQFGVSPTAMAIRLQELEFIAA